MKTLWRRLLWFAHRDRFDRELDEEMRHHLALKAEELGSAQAARRFGNVTLWKENSRAMWTGTFLEQLGQDIPYALRVWTANKLFFGLAVLSLALGIGANTAIYSFMDAIMIRALPVQHPEQLVILNWRAPKKIPIVRNHMGTSYEDPGGQTSPNFPYPAYEFLRKNNQVFSTLLGYSAAGRLNLVVDGQAELGEGQYVSGDYFSALGVGPAAGRLIAQEDDRAGAAPVVTISYGFWQRRFGASDVAIGKSILINGRSFVIAGVSAPQFFGVRPQAAPVVFIPIHALGLVDLNRYSDVGARFIGSHFYWIEMMGRLKSGISLRQTGAVLGEQFHQWVAGTAENDKERSVLPALWVQEGGSGVDSLRRQYSKPLFILMTMAALLLTIACANIANLLLARAAARRREMAVRLSLGAGRLRIVRQLLTESLILAVSGGLLGIFVALAGIRSLTLLLANGRDDFTLRAELDWRVLFFTLAIALAAGILFGLAPAVQSTKVDVTPALKEARSANSRTRRFGLSHTLVVTQIALSLLLVAVAGLFVRTLGNLHAVDIGFNRENVLLFNINAAQAGYKGTVLTDFYTDLYRRFRALPSVRNATMTQMPLVAGWTSSTGVTIPGLSPPIGERLNTSMTQIGPHFFETMQIPILLGRPLDARDRAGAPLTAVVNEVFAKKYFSGVSLVGRHFGFGGVNPVDTEIVGVARNTRYNSLKREIPPVVYTSYLQAGKNPPIEQMYFELRTAADPLALANVVRRIVHRAAPSVPVAEMTTQSRVIDSTIVQERTFASLCTGFGALALIMACVGLYATMAYAVARRTTEIGIRMALGALRHRVVWLVLRDVLLLAAIGLALGLVLVFETTAFLKSFLFGLQPNDPIALASAAAILVACAFLAGYIPAWRAARIDPMQALRHE